MIQRKGGFGQEYTVGAHALYTSDGRLYRSERRKRGGAPPARPAQQRAEFPPIRTNAPGSPGPW